MLYSFHQEELYIVEGRAFTDEDMLWERVIVISDLMAARLEKTIGDEIDLSFFPSDRRFRAVLLAGMAFPIRPVHYCGITIR